MKDFTQLWNSMQQAAEEAAKIQNNKLPPESARGFDCGFAWICFPGNTAFGRWATQQKIASRRHPKGLMIWYSKLHSVPTQSISVHEAACQAATRVLAKELVGLNVYCDSRLD